MFFLRGSVCGVFIRVVVILEGSSVVRGGFIFFFEG